MEADWDTILQLGGSALFALYFAFHFLRKTRIMENTPTSRIRSASQGFVELEGVTRQIGNTLATSPLTETKCLWWFYKVEKRVKSGKNSYRWQTEREGSSTEFFYIEDSTGRCAINPAGAEVVAVHEKVWRQLGKRYTEKYLHPNEALYALGLFKSRNVVTDTRDQERAAEETLLRWQQDSERRQQLDSDGNGILSEKEMLAARQAALAEIHHEQSLIANEGLHTLSKPGVKSQPFILSAITQEQLVKRWRWYARGCFAWFLVGGGFCVKAMIEAGVL